MSRTPSSAACCATVALAAALGAGCASPIRVDESCPDGLRHIHAAFVRTVAAARTSETERWHSGWFGNVLVNVFERENRGLCYEWQQTVYDGVEAAALEVGWIATGIAADEDSMFEHHAVVVFDPAEMRESRILERPWSERAWVLDAWWRGRADVYRLDQWLTLTYGTGESPRIEPLNAGASEP